MLLLIDTSLVQFAPGATFAMLPTKTLSDIMTYRTRWRCGMSLYRLTHTHSCITSYWPLL